MNETARASQKLLIGPWAHLFPYTSPTSTGTGDIDFGPAALIDLHEIQLRWFDHWLKGVDTGILDEPPVKIFVMGENRWRDEREWPLARTRYTPYYLHSAGRANSANGDGALSPEMPGEEPPDQYIYDPADPVPTRGGNTADPRHGRAGPAPGRGARRRARLHQRADDRAARGHRADRRRPSSPPAAPPTPTSPPSWSTSAPTATRRTSPTGSSAPATATSRETPTPLTPGEVTRFTIDLWATSNVFLPGHRIRLEITSSNFPRFDRNLNTGEDQATATRGQPAQQTVFHDARYPSHVVLPVIPR